jgi:hypothetical protein
MQTTELVAEAAIELRPFRPADQAAALALFRRVLHDLAPPGMEASAEKYIAEAVARITATWPPSTRPAAAAASGSRSRRPASWSAPSA